ncbi:hypothetical protein ABZS66_39665 [Dactylosporangium sp. NPDC005572]|uniref:hypothetical protein n=1 Tax=Dactylosporangium sp. NPDC005572 TaxID=3156889 RepID=UPI0033A33E2B
MLQPYDAPAAHSHNILTIRVLPPPPLRRSTGWSASPGRPALLPLVRVAAAVAVLLATAAVLFGGVPTITEPAEPVVRRLYTALADRDTDTLSAIVDCHASPLCQPGALATGYQPPEHARITRLEQRRDIHGSRTTVAHVQYELDHVTRQDTVTLSPERVGLFHQRWRVTTPPGRHLQLQTSYVDRIRLAGATITATSQAAPREQSFSPPAADAIWAPPGRYTAVGVPTALYDTTEVTTTITGQATTPVTLHITATLKPAITTAVNDQIATYLSGCAAQHDLQPRTDPTPRHRCPFAYDAPYTITDDPHWVIDSRPTIQLEPVDANTLTAATTTAGQATVTYRWSTDIIEPRRWNTAAATVTYTLAGTVTTVDGTITWTPG